MAKPVDILPGEGWIIAFVKEAVAKGIGLEELQSTLAAAEKTVRLEAVTSAYNYLNTVVRPDLEYIKFLQQFAQPNLLRVPVNPVGQTRNFAYIIERQGINRLSGEIDTQMVQFEFNTLISKQEALDRSAEIQIPGAESDTLESYAATVTGIFQNPSGLTGI